MTATQSNIAHTDDFVFPEATGGFEMRIGMFPATLVGFERPVRSDFADEATGEFPLRMKLIWKLDEDPDRDQWSWINPERRGARSNFFKVYKALTNNELKFDTEVRMAQLVGRRAQLIMTESEKKPGTSGVTGYAPIARTRPAVVQQRPPERVPGARVPAEIPREDVLGQPTLAQPIDTDDPFGDVPF